MRKLVLVVMLALAVPAAALARPVDRGDGTLAVKSATGRITVTARGTILGRVDDGQVAITDLSANASNDVQVFGADQKPSVRPNGTVVYVGTGMRFRIVGGRYSVEVLGRGISLSAVGKGGVQGLGMTDGIFATDGQAFRPMLPGVVTDVFGQ